MQFLKTFFYLYLFSFVMMSFKTPIRITDILSSENKFYAERLSVRYETDYKHICDGCEFKYSYGKVEYWKGAKKLWSDVTWGSGSGSLSKANMGASPATSPGDVLKVVAGTYSGFTLNSCTNVTVDMQTTRVHSTGTFNMSGNDGVVVRNIDFTTSGTAVQFTNHNQNGGLNHIAFINNLGDCINSDATRTAYAGTTASLSLYQMTFDSITANASDYLHRLNFGDIAAGKGFSDSLVYTRVRIIQTRTNGEEIRGVCFRLKMDQWYVTYSGTNPRGGDVGLCTVYGNGIVSNITQDGSAGYIARFYNTSLKTHPSDVYLFNLLKTNGRRYGLVSTRVELAQITAFTQGNHTFFWNSGIINSIDDGGYITSGIVQGAMSDGTTTYTLHMYNIYAVNNASDASNTHLMHNDAGGLLVLDSGHNFYVVTNTGAVDPTTYIPGALSGFRNGGITKYWMPNDAGLDRNGVAFEATRPVGPLAFHSVAPCAGCIFFKRQTKFKQG